MGDLGKLIYINTDDFVKYPGILSGFKDKEEAELISELKAQYKNLKPKESEETFIHNALEKSRRALINMRLKRLRSAGLNKLGDLYSAGSDHDYYDAKRKLTFQDQQDGREICFFFDVPCEGASPASFSEIMGHMDIAIKQREEFRAKATQLEKALATGSGGVDKALLKEIVKCIDDFLILYSEVSELAGKKLFPVVEKALEVIEFAENLKEKIEVKL